MGPKEIGRLFVLSVWFVTSAYASEALRPGIIIETVASNSASERAGLEEGDLVVGWSRGDVRGEIQSPFDLTEVEIEHAPRGTVTLEGLRGTEKNQWRLDSDDWGISARPNFQENLLSLYHDGRELAKAGNLSQAVDRWHAALETHEPLPAWVNTWLLFHSAELYSKARQWQEADNGYRQAIQKAGESGPVVNQQLLKAWAASFRQRSDWSNSEKYYEQAISEALNLTSDRLAAAASMDELGTVYLQQGNLEQAAKYFQRAADARAELAPNSLVLARSINNLGIAVARQGDLAKAEEYFHRALEIRQKLAPEGLEVATTLNGLGLVALRRGNLAQSEEFHRHALRIRQNLAPGSVDLAVTFNSLGLVEMDQGDLAAAEDHYRQALSIRQKLAPETLDVATLLNNLGLVALSRGDLVTAEDYFHQALDLRQKLAPESLDVAATLNNLGIVAIDRGDLVKGEGLYRRALDIKRRLAPDSLEVATVLNNLGDIADLRGDLAKAEGLYQEAFDLRQKLAPGSLDLAGSLANLGNVALQQGNLTKAQECYEKALDIKLRLGPGRIDNAEDFGDLGTLAMEREDLVKAEDYFHQQIAIAERLAPKSLVMASSLQNLGNLAHKRNDVPTATQYFRRALAIRETVAPGSEDHADTLLALAAVAREQGQLDAAEQLFQKALQVLESQTVRLGGTEEDHLKFRARHTSAYKDYIDLLVAENHPELALQTLERWRARSLLQMLNSARIDVRKGIDPALLEQERSLREAVAIQSNRRIKILSDKHTDDQVAVINKKLEELLAQQKDVESQIRATSPVYAALTQPQPLNAKEIQQLLDHDMLLLEYSLGEERSYVWALTAESLSVAELPKRSAIEAAARQVYGLLTERNRQIKTETELARDRRFARTEASYPGAVNSLSQMVLGPIAAQLAGKRLLIVSDGALQYIPFAILPSPETRNAAGSRRSKHLVPLVVEHEIIHLPSASLLAVLRRETMERKQAPKAVAVLADPVFDAQDRRVSNKPHEEGGAKDPENEEAFSEAEQSQERLTRSAVDAGLSAGEDLRLARLPFTRQEAKAVLAATPAGQGMNALDFKASRATAMSPELADYRIVHFATHGLLDSRHPELSGLVFSLVDEQGQPQNGYLELQDVYNLNLPAELVVLSGCETGLGEEISGEGLVGLTRGFMYAGAGRVLASLWNVDDVATAELMGRFYRAMEHDAMRPAAALRQAQTEMWKQQRWNAPYYWAAFTLQGE
jgi:CHAT domain-containing protein/Flp pilus assembly protein TadD